MGKSHREQLLMSANTRAIGVGVLRCARISYTLPADQLLGQGTDPASNHTEAARTAPPGQQ